MRSAKLPLAAAAAGLLLVSSPSVSGAQAAPAVAAADTATGESARFEFGGVRWGEAAAKVRQAFEPEFSLESEETDRLLYRGDVAGRPAKIFCVFAGGELQDVMVLYGPADNTAELMDTFEHVVKRSLGRYGKPDVIEADPKPRMDWTRPAGLLRIGLDVEQKLVIVLHSSKPTRGVEAP